MAMKYRSVGDLRVGTRPHHVTISLLRPSDDEPEVEISINTGDELSRFIRQLQQAEQEIRDRAYIAAITGKDNR